jgi:hypothetical protein
MLQGALRFALEIAALVGIGVYGGWPLGLALVGVAIVLWGVFAVPGDPSRSGKAPVKVPGKVRLLVELAVFVGGAVAMALHGWWIPAGIDAGLLIVHHTGTLERLRWLVRQ